MATLYEIAVMRLRGAPYSDIASSLGCSRRDISSVVSILNKEGISSADDPRFEPGLFDEYVRDDRSRRTQSFDQPNFDHIVDRLRKNRHVTRHKLWLDYCADPCDEQLVKYSYSQFCEVIKVYVDAKDLRPQVEHYPGQELQVDWAGDKVAIIDAATGTVGMKASVFLAVCPYSGLIFATAKPNERMDSWIDAHIQALEFIGGVPATIIPDNASTATYRPKKKKSYRAITSRYADFATHYDVMIVPTRPAKPREKASVERSVQTAYSLILGYFDQRVFHSLDELNDAIAERVADVNDLVRPDGSTRKNDFDVEEAPLLRALPTERFDEIIWKMPKVDTSWHVRLDNQYYSVPYTLVGKTLRARLSRRLVSIYHGDQLVAEHTRQYGKRFRYFGNDAHNPPNLNQIDGDALTPDKLRRWASSYGSYTLKVINQVLDLNKASHARGLKLCHTILAVRGPHAGKTTLEPACQVLVERHIIPTIAAIKRAQQTIAAERVTDSFAATAKPQQKRDHHASTKRTPAVVDATDVFIRTADHYTTSPRKEA